MEDEATPPKLTGAAAFVPRIVAALREMDDIGSTHRRLTSSTAPRRRARRTDMRGKTHIRGSRPDS